MLPLAKRLGLSALVLAAVLAGSASAVQAQAVVSPLPQPAPLKVFSPYFRAPSVQFSSAQYASAVYRNQFPYGVGYNAPYVGPVINPFVPTPTPYYTCLGFCPGGGQLYANLPAYSGSYYNSPGSGYGGSPGYGYSGGYGGYGGWYQDPYNGYLTGAAAVIQSQGQFAKDWQTSRLMKEQVKQASIDTQRRMIDEWLYERNLQPKLEEIRRAAIEQAWQRAIFQPPANDIWSADALNRILDHANRAIANGGGKGPEIAIDPDMLSRLNVSTGVAGNIAALRDKGKLTWPSLLHDSSFDKERERFSDLAKAAVDQASSNGSVKPNTLKQMAEDLRSMTEKLSARVGDLDPNDYNEAKRYLRELSQAMKILKRPDVGDYFNGKYKAEGKSAGELIRNMGKNGLRFAPAAQGDEAAYNAIYQALVAYDLDLARKSPGKD
jgi:hypothetical protein